MPTNYSDQFFVMDPGNPPAYNASLTVQNYGFVDQNDDGLISVGVGDQVNGRTVTAVYVGDRIRVVMNGVTQWITGVTFYVSGGPAIFTPTDGTILSNARFRSSEWVPNSTQIAVGTLGPPCFTPGTMILTPTGEVPVEDLAPGDLVLTRDDGAQPLRWTGRCRVDATGDFAPVRFATGTIGNSRPLLVSPQHRILITGWQAELACGIAEVFVAAKHLVDGHRITRAPQDSIDYIHLMFDRHQIVTSNGAPTESFFPGDVILEGDRALRAELNALFPALEAMCPPEEWQTVRPVARGAELRCLAA